MTIRIFHALLFVFVMISGGAQAHFLTDSQSREFHVVTDENGMFDVLVRYPLTFAYASELASRLSPDDTMAAPFLNSELIAGRTFYRLDVSAARSDHTKLTAFLTRDIQFSVDGVVVEHDLRDIVIVNVPQGAKPPSGRSELEAILDAQNTLDTGYVSELVVVLAARVPGLGAGNRLSIEITAAEFQLPPSLHVSNRFTDHRSDPPQVLTQHGFWPPAASLSGNALAGFVHFVWQGVIHILLGPDHLLFVVCLALAASGWRALLISITGFTIGHSVTLSAGVLGYLPRADWFIPSVELGVAASIIVMAALILVRRSGPMGFVLAASLGLLHGFGFAFMLAPMLGESVLLLPLAGFNFGVELGQLLIVVPLVAALWLIDQKTQVGGRTLRYAAAATAILIALVWSYERTDAILAALNSVGGSGV